MHRKSNWSETLLVVAGDHECGYLCGPGSAAAGRMLPVANGGKGNLPGMEWNYGDHANSPIPLYAKGRTAVLLFCYADECDLVRGPYLDNTELAEMISGLLR